MGEESNPLATCHSVWAVLMTIIVLLYVFFDVNHFLRLAFTIGWGRLFEKRKTFDESTEIYGIATTQDMDIFIRNLSNARYIRELDFARFHFYDRTGLYDEFRKINAHVLQSATNIRYRKPIPMFSTYKITTKVIYWEEKALYIEHQFVTLSDGFVRAVVLSKQGTIGMDVPQVMAKLTGRDVSYRPEPPAEFQDWISSMEKSSNRWQSLSNCHQEHGHR
ncbi:unnamed protein product [Phaedon cochleariae]|uniref:Protein THEM6 n=1 Tax=Phaedon cochleariae TaxID=80249 RepID=A0A9P0DPM1_PHACE|nr:unnamed protein product [Phaedon cochleariae]